MKTLAAGFGVRVIRHRDGTYSMIENGYESAIEESHARSLCATLGSPLPYKKVEQQ